MDHVCKRTESASSIASNISVAARNAIIRPTPASAQPLCQRSVGGQTYVSLHGKIKYYYTHDCTYKLYNMWLHIQTYVIAHTNLCDCTQKSRVIARIWNFRRDDDLSWENNHVLDLPSHILAMWRTLNDIKNYIYRFPTYFKTFVDVVSEHM